jgi:shikimate dehydrogenase
MPVSHSLSPVLHAAAHQALGLTWWRYDAIECNEARLPALLDSCGPDWAGLSLTMPLKRTVLPLLDRAEPLVTEVGAANTVILAAAQRLGYNTDVPGMVSALAERGIGPRPSVAGAAVTGAAVTGAAVTGAAGAGATGSGAASVGEAATGQVLILGAGATACAALAAVRDLGAQAATVAVRDPARAADLDAAAGRLGIAVTLRPFEPTAADGMSLIISTVPAGAADSFAQIFPAPMPCPPVVFDVVYHPWPTRLAAAARQAGAIVVGGFDLLLHQAAVQVELMTGRPAPLDAMRQAGLAELARRAAMA